MVVGGSGFVGSHVADALAEAGHQVTIFDLRPYNALKPGQQFCQGDMLNSQDVEQALQGQGAVYNFAGLADIEECQSRPVDTVAINVVGNALLLEGARKAGVQRYVFASTIYVYSEAGGFYRASKQSCEAYIEEYQRQFGLDYTILRYGTLYGRRADDRNSVHRYLKQALLERKIVCYGTGHELREYIHAEDAARASVEILAAQFRNQYVILTGHHPMKFRELLGMIREIVGEDVGIEYRPPGSPTNDLKHSPHYNITPYSFRPRIGKKLVSHYYLDMGQGLLDCLEEIYAERMASGNESPRSKDA
ncbi:MAG: NAD-dependent epimerase/dehydratase family protein [Dehalococcoidia bacterium]